MIEGLVAFVGTDYVSGADVARLRVAHEGAIRTFAAADRVDAVVEALGFTEYELNSVFARSDRDPYEGLLEVARRSELTDNTFIRPTLLEARSLWKKYARSRL